MLLILLWKDKVCLCCRFWGSNKLFETTILSPAKLKKSIISINPALPDHTAVEIYTVFLIVCVGCETEVDACMLNYFIVKAKH